MLAKNANGGFSFGRILDTFNVSDISLNKIAKDTVFHSRIVISISHTVIFEFHVVIFESHIVITETR